MNLIALLSGYIYPGFARAAKLEGWVDAASSSASNPLATRPPRPSSSAAPTSLSSVVASQIATHARYGGVVPELASREHLRAIVPVVRAALAQANVTLAGLDAIAVTSGPGLAGALLVGITYAKALAFAQGLPLIAVNHLEGHIHAVLLHEQSELPGRTGSSFLDDEPALALVVSGGHTHLYLAPPRPRLLGYSLVGRTLDDAAGEAFDKVAKLLGFGYPGGPWIDALARFGNPLAVPFSFSQIKPRPTWPVRPPRAPRPPAPRPSPTSIPVFSSRFRASRRPCSATSNCTTCAPRPRPAPRGCFPAGLGMRNRALREWLPGTWRPQLSISPSPATREEALALCPQILMDERREAIVQEMSTGTVHYIPGHTAHRVVNTGDIP